ncbi:MULTISPECIES: hypothetical protein [Mumia]|uniref:Uncharacterized protein n=1 Tax=Mumia xiangluensis TaxID=1678900 RepID=A0ABW1QQ05_9ACTN|nr:MULTISPECIES: hypothetical protein [Mumia]
MPSATTSPPRPGADEFRVPVEHRFLGLDKRSFPFAFIVLALWLVMHLAIPHLNEAITGDDSTAAGDRMLVTRSLAITPTADWQVELGLRTTDDAVGDPETIELTKGGVQFVVQADDFDGDATALLDQIERVSEASDPGVFKPATARSTVTTSSGITGVSETVQGANATGRVVALTDDGTGIEIQVGGPSDEMDRLAAEIDQMIKSLGPVDTQEQS